MGVDTAENETSSVICLSFDIPQISTSKYTIVRSLFNGLDITLREHSHGDDGEGQMQSAHDAPGPKDQREGAREPLDQHPELLEGGELAQDADAPGDAQDANGGEAPEHLQAWKYKNRNLTITTE